MFLKKEFKRTLKQTLNISSQLDLPNGKYHILKSIDFAEY